ncbi:IS3 family transposase [Clostridium tetani]|nr:IS3 family transposase [Clostridium tetani]
MKKKEPTLADRLYVASKWIESGVSVVFVLRVVKVAKSTYYNYISSDKKERKYDNVGRKTPGFSYTFGGRKVNDLEIENLIANIKTSKTSKFYGYRKVTVLLRRDYNIRINKKKVYRLMSLLNLLGDSTKYRKPRISRICECVRVAKSNQLWQMDIKYCFITGTRKTAYITSIIDVFDRSIVSQSIDLSATGNVAKSTLLKGLYCRGLKDSPNGLIIRTDNGSQFISGVFEKACLKEEVIHERIPVRSPNYNAYIESFHRYLQDECLTGKIYMTLEDLKIDVEDYVYRYNHERIHSSIGYYSPHDYYIKNVS